MNAPEPATWIENPPASPHGREDPERRLDAAPRASAISLVVFSGELDKLLAGFVIATGAAACGMKASMFFTFWGTAALKKAGRQARGKSWIEWLFGWMLPAGLHKRRLSHLDMAGLGRRLMAREMRQKNIPDLPALIDLAAQSGVEIFICEMSMHLMGIRPEELIDYPNLKYCGVAGFLQAASTSNATLFI